MAPKRHGLFCRLRSRVRRLARRNGDRSASHDSAPFSSDNARHGPYLDINIHDFDDSDSTTFSSSTSSSTTVRARAEAAIAVRVSEQHSVDPRNPDLRHIRNRLDFGRRAGASQPRSSMPAERDVSPSSHDVAGPSLAPVTEEAARQASSRTQRPLPAVPRVDSATPPLVPSSNPGPSSAAPMPARAQPATAANFGSDSGSAPPRPPRNPERAQSVAARDAGEALVAPNTGESSAQANPDPQPPSPAPTHIEYPASPPPPAASPEALEPASAPPQPAMPTIPEFLSRITRTLDTISEQLDANNSILVERINITSGHSYRILGDIVQATQRRDGRSATLSSSYEAPSGASGALPPEPPEVVSGIPAGRAETPQPELIADSEQSPYVPTELDTPHDDVPASLSIDIVEEDNELLPVDLGGGGDAHAAEAATAPAQALNPMNGPLDESEVREYATGSHEDAATLANAAGVLSQPDQVVGADVGQADGSQEPAAPFEALPSASDVASLSDDNSERSVMEPTAAPDEGPIDTLVSCRSTNEFCPGTLQLIVDVGTNGVVRTGDKLFFLGNFDEAINRLPSICTARDTQWSKLHLRIGQSEERNGQDPMLRVLSCLRPFLRRFIGVHLVMDVDREVQGSERGSFNLDFLCLRSLCVEGKITRNRLLVFPLHQLRHLNIQSKLGAAVVLDALDRSKLLEVLSLDVRSLEGRQSNLVGAIEGPLVLPRYIRFPPAMYIMVDELVPLVPQLVQAAETTTTDLRLRVANPDSCSTEMERLFDRREDWVLRSGQNETRNAM